MLLKKYRKYLSENFRKNLSPTLEEMPMNIHFFLQIPSSRSRNNNGLFSVETFLKNYVEVLIINIRRNLIEKL